jgi:hypothetical protein
MGLGAGCCASAGHAVAITANVADKINKLMRQRILFPMSALKPLLADH